MSADEMVGQIYSWLSEADTRFEIEALLDLPDLDWVEIKSMSDRGADLISITYNSRGVSGWLAKHSTELICQRSAVKAVRKTERVSLDIFPDR